MSKQKDDVNWIDISPYWNSPNTSSMTFVDIFCGAGGLSKGFEMAGLQGVCGLDFFDEACATYKRNFNHPIINADVKIPENKELLYETVKNRLNGKTLDIVAGGFPCQGFSMSGKRIVEDPRNSLYKELLEIVKELNPNFVICENVTGLRSMLNGEVERKIISDFEKIGYKMNVTVLCAADYYAPSCTIKENHGGVNLHPKLPRVLTAREMARLQSFPDDFIFEGKKNKQLVQLGNAVPPLLGKAIGLAVRLSNGDAL